MQPHGRLLRSPPPPPNGAGCRRLLLSLSPSLLSLLNISKIRSCLPRKRRARNAPYSPYSKPGSRRQQVVFQAQAPAATRGVGWGGIRAQISNADLFFGRLDRALPCLPGTQILALYLHCGLYLHCLDTQGRGRGGEGLQAQGSAHAARGGHEHASAATLQRERAQLASAEASTETSEEASREACKDDPKEASQEACKEVVLAPLSTTPPPSRARACRAVHPRQQALTARIA
jgi:hypothetical protein